MVAPPRPRPRRPRRRERARDAFRVAFEHAPVAVGVCDGDGRFVSANAALGDLLGLDADTLLGRPFLTFVHPDARSASLARYFRSAVVAAGGATWRPERHEMPCLSADGSVVWTAVTWTMTAPDRVGDQYAVVHLVDITDRRRAEDEAAELRQRFELAFQCSPVGFAIVDLHAHLVQTNPTLQDMLGYSASELQDRTVLDITHVDDRASTAETFDRLLSGELDHDTSVKRYTTSTGTTVFARRVAAILRDGPTPRYFLLQIENITGELEARTALREGATRDPLTGLATRESLDEELAMSATPRTLVLVGLRDLPRLNGALGRDGSDEILRTVAARLVASCRPDDRVARVSSSQFAILINDCAEVAATLAQRIASTMATPVAVGHHLLIVDASVATVDDPYVEQNLDSLLQYGDLALTSDQTAAPHASWRQFSPAMLTVSTRQVTIESELRGALASGRLSVVYQPIVEVATGTTRAFEVLSRWQHETLGEVSPSEFVPAAERSGLLYDFTLWTLTAACTDLAGWTAASAEAVRTAVAVNVAPQCLLEPGFADHVTGILAARGVPGQQLIIEITEQSLAHESDTIHDNLHDLTSAGIRIAVDDFGTGQSGLARLDRYPVTEIKLDRSFISGIHDPTDEAPLVRAAIAMARELDLVLTAEGVETQTQLALLRRYYCPQAQGFLLGPPRPAVVTGRTFG